MKAHKQTIIWALTHYGWLFILGGLIALVNFYHSTIQDSDTGCFSAVATAMRHGKVLYKDVWDNKAPGIFFIHRFFQWVTGNSIFAYIGIQTFFSALFFVSFMVFLRKWFPLAANLGIGIAVVFWVYWVTQWRYFYVGGFTEEIGFYCLAAGYMLWMLNEPKNGLNLLAGCLIGFAILIKEPFVFLLFPLLIGMWFQKPTWNQLKWLSMGVAMPLICWALYLTCFGAWSSYFQYIRFAADYGASAGKMVETQKEIELFFFDFWKMFPEIKRTIMIALFASVFVVASKENRFFLMVSIALFMSSLVFLFLGEQLYGHYWIPLFGTITILFVLSSSLIIQAVLTYVNQKVVNKNARALILVCVSLAVLYKVDSYRLLMLQQSWNDPNFIRGAEKERNTLKLWETGKSLFVADQSLGRIYYYLNASNNLKFICPYYVYFDAGEENKHHPLAIENRRQFDSLWTVSPPHFILESDTRHWVSFLSESQRNNYRLRDSLQLDNLTVRRWEKRED